MSKIKKDRCAVVYGLYHEDILLYVGSTVDIGARYSKHIESLAQKKHANKTLQKYINDNPGIVPVYKILHTCKDDSTIRKFIAEMVCIDIYRPKCNKPIIQYNFRTSRNMGFPKIPFEKDILQYL